LNRTVALKMISAPPGVVPDGSVLARFRTEAEAVARLKHPHIVPVYAFGEHAGQPYFALELIDGTTLARQLDGTPWPPRQAAALVSTLAGAVHYAHQRGILHRDLKPANILLDARGQPYVTDFGLARDLHGDQRTSEGAVLGTPAYMSPEQASGRTGELGPATDVFGLGAIFYQLLTGRPVYQGTDQVAVVKQAGRGEVTPPRQVNPRIPRALAAICLKALAADARQRQPSAAVLEQELRRYLGRSRRVAVAGGLAGLLALVVLTLTLMPYLRPAARTAPLELQLSLSAAKKGNDQRLFALDEPNVLPLRAGDALRVEARSSRPAYFYVLNMDAEGKVWPLYPWRRNDWDNVPGERPRDSYTIPEDPQRDASKLTPGPSGVESVVVLARETRLSDAERDRLRQALGAWPKEQGPGFDPLRAAVTIGADEFHFADARDGESRGAIAPDNAVVLQDPVLRLRRLLQEDVRSLGVASRGVCYNFQGK
jgi:hypothetical protein